MRGGGGVLIDNEIKELCDSEVLEQVNNDVNEVPFISPIFVTNLGDKEG